MRFSPVFAGLEAEIRATIDHLVSTGFLAVKGDTIALGAEGRRRYGGRVRELLATFVTNSHVSVVDPQGRPIGEVDWSLVEAETATVRRRGLLLGGRSWRVVSVSASPGKVVVEPGEGAVAHGWRGASLPVSRATWEAAREVLLSTEVPADIDPRSETWLETIRRTWRPRLDAPVTASTSGVVAHTFAGEAVHQSVLHALDIDGTTDGPTLQLFVGTGEVRQRAEAAIASLPSVLDNEARRLAESMSVAHRNLCALDVLVAEAREFAVDRAGIEAVLTLLATWPS